MSSCVDIEIRPESTFTSRERAEARDYEVRSLIELMIRAEKCWSRLGELCYLVEKDEDWKELGFSSYGSWMMDLEKRSGYGRASLYEFRDLVRELRSDIPNLDGVRRSSAHTLKQLPSSVRRAAGTITDAKAMEPEDFKRKVVKDHPEAHLELTDKKTLRLTTSQGEDFDESLATYRILSSSPTASVEEFIHFLCVDYLDTICEEGSPYSRREKARQLTT